MLLHVLYEVEPTEESIISARQVVSSVDERFTTSNSVQRTCKEMLLVEEQTVYMLSMLPRTEDSPYDVTGMIQVFEFPIYAFLDT